MHFVGDQNTLTLSDTNSASSCIDLFEIYARASGSELNRGKSKGIEWISQKKLLGIIFGYGDLKQANWSRIFKSFCLVLQENMCRNTSLYGRSLVANSLAVSKIVFVAQHSIIPSDFRDRFTTKLFDFIWNRKDNQPR